MPSLWGALFSCSEGTADGRDGIAFLKWLSFQVEEADHTRVHACAVSPLEDGVRGSLGGRHGATGLGRGPAGHT